MPQKFWLYDTLVCTPGDVRLVDGSNSNEGRVELCHYGVWGTVCDDSWDNTDASVVCRQLNLEASELTNNMYYEYTLPSLDGTALRSAYFGQGNGPILLNNVSCNGNELFLANCTNTSSYMYNCTHSEDAGVMCLSECMMCIL